MKRYLLILIFIIGFICFGYYVERMPYFSNVRDQLRRFTIPSPPVRIGKRGEIMEKLGLKYVVPKEYTTYFNPKTGQFTLRDIIGLQPSRIENNDTWTVPDNVDPEKLPSSLVMDKTIIKTGLPILSVVVDEDDLYNELTGIFTNHQKKGKKWERLSFISYYHNKKLLFASGAGVRVHGGGDRSMKYKGLRFYFRDVYGANQFKNGLLFDKKREPIQRVIVRKEPAFFNAIALDISRKIGCLAPYTLPVKVYFNGSLYDDQFVLTEHISEDYLYSLFGHKQFLIERTIKKRRSRSKEFEVLRKWAADKNSKITMEEVEKRIDIKNLSLWWISQLFCAGKDHYQGPAVLNKKNEGAKWFWINWDMDQCIQNTREKDKKVWEQELCLYEVMNETSSLDRKDPRGVLFRRLINEDPNYKNYFLTLLSEALNHNLSSGYIESRIRYYENMATSLNVSAFNDEDIRLYFKKRPKYLRKLMRKYIHSPQSYPCSVKVGKSKLLYKVDGYFYENEYKGWYYKGTDISVTLSESDNGIVKYWLVNGKKINKNMNSLKYKVNAPMVIVPVI